MSLTSLSPLSKKKVQFWLRVSALIMGAGVMLGAFGAHSLRARIDPSLLTVFEKGVLYHFIHSLGALATLTMITTGAIGEKRGLLVCKAFIFGILLFSGSLYILAITAERSFGAITPVGGLAFIAGWLALGFPERNEKE